MRILLEPDLSSYSDAAYEADLKLLPPQRYEKALRFRFLQDRKRCVRAYMLLWEGLREYGLRQAPVFDFEPRGKPFLPEAPGLHFSLSHTGNAVLCALDSRPVGADIEMIHPSSMKHLLRVLSEEEKSALERAACPELVFTQFWTRKESYLKLTGEGLTSIKAMREIPGADRDRVSFETVSREEDGFVYSLCRWR